MIESTSERVHITSLGILDCLVEDLNEDQNFLLFDFNRLGKSCNHSLRFLAINFLACRLKARNFSWMLSFPVFLALRRAVSFFFERPLISLSSPARRRVFAFKGLNCNVGSYCTKKKVDPLLPVSVNISGVNRRHKISEP